MRKTTDMEKMNSNKRGGYREGAGRKKTTGTRHTWKVPEDIEKIASEKGIAYIWEAVRFKERFDAINI